MNGKYDDIIGLPHPDPKHHPRMSLLERAAQFAPFAALTGFSGVIDAAARRVNAGPPPPEDDGFFE